MVLGVVVDGEGRPVCTEMAPGNTADVSVLVPVVDRLRSRFAIGRVCVVADRGMISTETIAALEARGLDYILGVRERTDKRVRDIVLADDCPFVPLVVPRANAQETDLAAKEVTVCGIRYIVCRNEDEAAKGRRRPHRHRRRPRKAAEEGRQGADRQLRLPPLPCHHRPPLRPRSARVAAEARCAPTPD